MLRNHKSTDNKSINTIQLAVCFSQPQLKDKFEILVRKISHYVNLYSNATVILTMAEALSVQKLGWLVLLGWSLKSAERHELVCFCYKIKYSTLLTLQYNFTIIVGQRHQETVKSHEADIESH